MHKIRHERETLRACDLIAVGGHVHVDAFSAPGGECLLHWAWSVEEGCDGQGYRLVVILGQGHIGDGDGGDLTGEYFNKIKVEKWENKKNYDNEKFYNN